MNRNRLLSLATVLLTVVACVALLEGGLAIAARVTASPILQPRGVESAQLVAAFRFEPGKDVGGMIANQRGYNDVDWSAQSPPDTFRVVSLGDSFAVAGGVTYAQNYNTLLEAPATPDRDAIEVLNHGVAAIGPSEYLWIYETEAAAVEHDAVLMTIFLGNDFTQPNEPPDRRELEGWYTWLAISRLLRVGALSGDVGKPEAPAPFTETTYREQGRWKAKLYEKTVKRHRERRFQRALDRIEEVVRRSPHPVVIAIAPDEIEVNDAFRDEVFTAYDLDPGAFDFTVPASRVAAIADRHAHATAIDLLPPLRRAEASARTYLDRDTHWSAHGHRVVAEAIRPAIEALARERRRKSP